MSLTEIGINIHDRRIFLNLKQEDLAEIAGVAIKTIYAIESGKANPSVKTLMKLLNVLGMEIITQIKKSK